MTEGNNGALITRITMLAHRHAAAADHLQKRKVCVAGEFHAYTADVLRDAAEAVSAAARAHAMAMVGLKAEGE